jgi:hypothetical protein
MQIVCGQTEQKLTCVLMPAKDKNVGWQQIAQDLTLLASPASSLMFLFPKKKCRNKAENNFVFI